MFLDQMIKIYGRRVSSRARETRENNMQSRARVYTLFESGTFMQFMNTN